jgi:hypothetical protein
MHHYGSGSGSGSVLSAPTIRVCVHAVCSCCGVPNTGTWPPSLHRRASLQQPGARCAPPVTCSALHSKGQPSPANPARGKGDQTVRLTRIVYARVHDPCKTSFDVTSRQLYSGSRLCCRIHHLLLLLGGGPQMSSFVLNPPIALLLDRVEIIAQEITARRSVKRVVEENAPVGSRLPWLRWRHRPSCVRTCMRVHVVPMFDFCRGLAERLMLSRGARSPMVTASQ